MFDLDVFFIEVFFGVFGGVCGVIFMILVDVVIICMINECKSNVDVGLFEDVLGTFLIDMVFGVYFDFGLFGFFVGVKECVLYWGLVISIFFIVYCCIW